MAAGKINLQKASGGVTSITGVDGTGNTEVVLPESGNVTSVDTAVTDNAIARFDSTTGKLQNSGVVIDDSDRLLVGNTPSGLNTLGQLIVNQPSSGNVNLALTNKINDSYSYIYNDGTALKISNSYNLTAGYTPIILQTGSSTTTLGANGNLLVGTTTDNGVDKLQVDGSINCNNKIVYQNSIIGTFTGDVWYDTGVTTDTLGYNILDTFAITIFENSHLTGNSNYQMSYKFIVGSAGNTSNSANTFDIPTLSAVGHAHNGGSVSLRWQHLHNSLPPKIQFKVTYTSTFDSPGKSLDIYVTKLI